MGRLQSVFSKLAISYVSIVLIIVILLCSIFYLYIPKNYNEEIRDKNKLILESTVNAIESTVFKRVQNIYLTLSLGKGANIDLYAQDTLQGNHNKVIELQELLLNQVTSNSDLVSAIHLYYPKQKVMLSSVYGLLFYDESRPDPAFSTDWIRLMREEDKSYLWTQARLVPKDLYTSTADNNNMTPLISYVHSYPFNSRGAACDVMIGVDFKEAALQNIIQSMMPLDHNSTMIVDAQGTVISSSDKGLLGTSVKELSYIRNILNATSAGSFADKIENNPYVVSHQSLPTTGWTIYNLTPQDTYYQKSIMMRKAVLNICLISLIVGLVLSGIFAVATYTPLKRLVNRIKGIFEPPTERGLNEYKWIDTAIHKLASRVSTLEDTLQANHPVIKHNIVMNMLKNRYSSREELEEQLQSLRLSSNYSHYCCLLVDPASVQTKQLDSRTIQYITYSAINQLEQLELPQSCLIAEELPDKRIAVIVCTSLPEAQLLEQLCGFILSEAEANFKLGFKISLGPWVQQIYDVHHSFSEAQVLSKYSFFLPDRAIINDRTLLEREQSTEEIPETILARFEKKLQARQLEEITEAIDQLVLLMREGPYAAAYCHLIMANMVAVYTDNIISLRYKQTDNIKLELHAQYSSIKSMDNFREWLVSSISEFIRDVDKRSDERNSDSIQAVKRYVQEHLSEELSLDTVAGKVYLSPKYLSKIFREETGITYTEYVTKQRMEKAIELLGSDGMTIEQVASTVGYNTAAYFIKKFKELYGCTPKNYVRDQRNGGHYEAI